MKSPIPAIALAALLGSGGVASAETTSAPAQLLQTPGTHLVLVDVNSGKTVAEYVAILVKGTPPGAVALPAPAFKRAFSDTAPLTIQQENEAAEHALEAQGPPLHTP